MLIGVITISVDAELFSTSLDMFCSGALQLSFAQRLLLNKTASFFSNVITVRTLKYS